MRICALLTTSTFIDDEKVRHSVDEVAELLHRKVIATDTMDMLRGLSVDIVFWLPGEFEEITYRHLFEFCPRIVYLAHINTRDPQGRMVSRGDVLIKPGMLTLVTPFNPEEAYFIITNRYKLPELE